MDEPVNPNTIKLTSDRFVDFAEALDILYIKGNISGRNKFTEAWPEAALHIFGEELIVFDREGASDASHRDRRSVLEKEAEARRLMLSTTVEVLEQKSVFEGALQIEYVQGLVMQYGRKLSLYFYSRPIVDRFIPPLPEEIAAEQAAAPPPPPPPREPKAESAPRVMPIRDDMMDHIKPISVDADMSPDPEPEPEDIGDLRPDQVAALQAQKDEFLDEAEDKPLFVAGVLPPAPAEEAPAEPAAEVPKEAETPKPETQSEGATSPSKKLSIFSISDADGGKTES